MGPIGKFNDTAEEQVLEVIKIHAIYSIVLILIYCFKNKVQIFSLAVNNVDECYQAASSVFFSPYSVLQSDCAIRLTGYPHSHSSGFLLMLFSLSKALPANSSLLNFAWTSGLISGVGNGNQLQYSSLGNPVNRGAQFATVHGGHRLSDMGAHDLATKQQQDTSQEPLAQRNLL